VEPAQSKVQWRQWVRVRVLGWNQHTAKYSGDNGLGLERVEPAHSKVQWRQWVRVREGGTSLQTFSERRGRSE